MKNKLSMVLPICSEEFGESSQMVRPGKRRMQDLSGLLMLLLSISKYLDFSKIDKFIIVCPRKDKELIQSRVTPFLGCLKIELILEEDLFESVYALKEYDPQGLGGWYFQQLIKLACANIVSTDYYITLDSDVILVKKLTMNDLFVSGKSVVNIESEWCYRSLYVNSFAEKEMAVKSERYRNSSKILSLSRDYGKCGFAFGETPVVLNRDLVVDLIEHLESLSDESWFKYLMRCSGWTEYGLYFSYALDAKKYMDVHISENENKVLDLRRSVWQPSKRYSKKRLYDYFHFFSGDFPSEGYFVAIQSWIPDTEWLPPNISSRSEFYELFWGWLEARG